MPRFTDPVLLARLKKEMCPGGPGHLSTSHFKSSCTLCRTQAELAMGIGVVPATSPASSGTTRPGPGDKKR